MEKIEKSNSSDIEKDSSVISLGKMEKKLEEEDRQEIKQPADLFSWMKDVEFSSKEQAWECLKGMKDQMSPKEFEIFNELEKDTNFDIREMQKECELIFKKDERVEILKINNFSKKIICLYCPYFNALWEKFSNAQSNQLTSFSF